MPLLQGLTGWHFLIILVVVLLIFGATRLPALAKSLGQSAKILRNELRSDEPAPGQNQAAEAPTAQAPAAEPTVAAPAEPQLNTTNAQPVGESSPSADQR